MNKYWPAILCAIAAMSGCGADNNNDDSLGKRAQMAVLEKAGNVVIDRMKKGSGHGGFHEIPITVKTIADNVLQVQGVANTNAIQTNDGYVLFDTGLVLQAVQQRKLLQPLLRGPLKRIILSHTHADHVGGFRIWKQPDTVTITHREFEEEQRYLTELDPYFYRRNQSLFPWMPENPPTLVGIMDFRGIKPDITVGDQDYSFNQGGVEFQVLSTPGAEGADNISLWLPQKKILFSGDTLGPLFPQFPNLFTARGEKIRKPIEYIHSLNKLIALQPEILVPSHHNHIVGRDKIIAGLTRIRDATQYVHDAVVAGMNDGKTVYQLMDEIKLPPELQLTEEHGKVSWGVKSIWEYYSTWFYFESPTELYHVPVREIYADIAELAGEESLIKRANDYLESGEPLKAQHLAEIVLASSPHNVGAIDASRRALETLRQQGMSETHNNYEYDLLGMYLQKLDKAKAK